MAERIPLSQGMWAIVDEADFERIHQFKWTASRKGKTCYAVRRTPRRLGAKMISLHDEIMQPRAGERVDHIDGNGLNCTRENMRVCTHAQNLQNRGPNSNNKSGYKGVCWSTKARKWLAQIGVRGKHIYLGSFESAEKAAQAYNTAALEHHGDFARINPLNK